MVAASAGSRHEGGLVTRITREARDGLMRAWLEILREKHPGVTWVPVAEAASAEDHPSSEMPESPAAVAA
jgi:hypothetical protein